MKRDIILTMKKNANLFPIIVKKPTLTELAKSAKKVIMQIKMVNVKNCHLIVHNVIKMINAPNVIKVMNWMKMVTVYLPIVQKLTKMENVLNVKKVIN